jgi:phage host-nuclease inhibitor protein Gam
MELKTWEQTDGRMQIFAETSAQLAEIQAKLDAEIVALRKRYAEAFRVVELSLNASAAALKKFAQGHKSEFKPSPAGDGRSYEHAGVTVGFRQSPGRVEIRNEDKTIEWLRDCRNGKFVRLIHQPNRDALLEVLRDGSDQRLVETLAAHGITFQQKDKFFLEVTSE